MENKAVDLTIRALVIGVILSLIMLAANMYLGLKGGMTISANIPCSVIAVILFNAIFRKTNIAEINVTQATGSVGEGMAAGVVFIFPALVFAGVFGKFSEWGLREYLIITAATVGGSILGVVFAGFLRRPMVVEAKELRFPEGVATAEILKTGMAALEQGKSEGLKGVGIAFLIGAISKIASSGVAIFKEGISYVTQVKNTITGVGADLSAALIGVGFIIEFEGAILVIMGGVIAWIIFIPLISSLPELFGFASNVPWAGQSTEDAAEYIWKNYVRFIGVGGMIVGGLWSIFKIRQQLLDSIRSVHQSFKGHSDPTDTEPDLSPNTIWLLILAGLLISAAVYFMCLPIVGAGIAIIYTALGTFFFVAISIYIVGMIGSTNQPVSGITICTFLLAAVFLFIGRQTGNPAILNILLLAGVVCLAVCLSGSAAQNFKTASIVGGTPRAMQIGLLVAVMITALFAAPLLQFLDKAYGIGVQEETQEQVTTPQGQPVAPPVAPVDQPETKRQPLPAPQSGMFAAMAKGIFDENYKLPWNMVGIGMGMGVALIALGELLKHIKSRIGISPMAVSVGIYLPFSTTLPIFLGGLIHLITRKTSRSEPEFNESVQRGTVFCSGLVAGEALIAILLAAFIFMGYELPFSIMPDTAMSSHIQTGLTVLVLLVIPMTIHWYIKASKPKEK